MPLVEDTEYEALKRKAGLADTALASKQILDTLGADPENRHHLLRMMKAKFPNMPIPELDAAAPYVARLDALEKKLSEREEAARKAEEERETKARTRSAEGAIDEGRSKLRKMGFNADGIEKIEKLMGDRGLIDYEAGAALFEKQVPPSEPVIPTALGRAMPMVDAASPDDLKMAVSLPKQSRSREQALQRFTQARLQEGWAEIQQQRAMQRPGGF